MQNVGDCEARCLACGVQVIERYHLERTASLQQEAVGIGLYASPTLNGYYASSHVIYQRKEGFMPRPKKRRIANAHHTGQLTTVRLSKEWLFEFLRQFGELFACDRNTGDAIQKNVLAPVESYKEDPRGGGSVLVTVRLDDSSDVERFRLFRKRFPLSDKEFERLSGRKPYSYRDHHAEPRLD